MSYHRILGKDRIIFATEEDHKKPSLISLHENDINSSQLPDEILLPDGNINWNSPRLGGMPFGPCGNQFKEAFSCLFNYKSKPKVEVCSNAFEVMHECMSKHSILYNTQQKFDNEYILSNNTYLEDYNKRTASYKSMENTRESKTFIEVANDNRN